MKYHALSFLKIKRVVAKLSAVAFVIGALNFKGKSIPDLAFIGAAPITQLRMCVTFKGGHLMW